MAVYAATLANGGTRITPHLLRAVDDGTGWKPIAPPAPKSRSPIDPEKLPVEDAPASGVFPGEDKPLLEHEILDFLHQFEASRAALT